MKHWMILGLLAFTGCATGMTPQQSDDACQRAVEAAQMRGYSRGLTKGIAAMRNSQKETLQAFENMLNSDIERPVKPVTPTPPPELTPVPTPSVMVTPSPLATHKPRAKKYRPLVLAPLKSSKGK